VADNTQFLGCVLNPKTNLPCPVYKEKQRTVEVYDPALDDKEGSGYFDDGDHGTDYSASEKSGFPRVHTPSGVKTRRSGYGTVLYTGLCLAAKLEDRGYLKIATNVAGAGISSNTNRSNAAEAWWSAAKNEFDLAYSVEVEGAEEEEEEEYEETITSTRGIRAVRDAVLAALDPEGDLYIDEVTVKGTIKRMVSTGASEADVYPYDRTQGCLGAKSMVPFWFVSEAYDGSDHLWTYNEKALADPNSGGELYADHVEIFDDVFGCMLLTSDVAPELIRFIQTVAAKVGKKKLFEEVMLVSMLGKTLEEAGETAYATDTLYEGLRPFRLNPEDPAVQAAVASLTKKERIAVERRAERVRALGLDKLAGFDL
jgi:hypothetical protein